MNSRSQTGGSKYEQVRFWKAVFERYDTDGSGNLSFDEIRSMIRVDLKLPERVVSDEELQIFFTTIDLNKSGEVDWTEWLDYVSQGRLKPLKPLDQVLDMAGRAIRLSLRRTATRPDKVEALIRSFPEGSGLSLNRDKLDFEIFVRILRRFGLQRHDCTDDNVKMVFRCLDVDNSGYIPLDYLLEFIKCACLSKMPRELGMGKTFPGLIGGMRGYLEPRAPCNRPGTFPRGTVSGPTMMPFCLNGRELPPASRLSLTLPPDQRRRQQLRPVISCPELPAVSVEALPLDELSLSPQAMAALVASAAQDESEKNREKDDSRPGTNAGISLPAPSPMFGAPHRSTLMPQSAYRASTAPDSMPSTPSMQMSPLALAQAARRNDATGDPFAVFKAAVVSSSTSRPTSTAESKPKERKEPTRGLRSKSQPISPLSPTGRYLVLTGRESLNRVEQRLFEAGVDVRGGFHRLGHSPERA